ncbi:hypothetical protein C9J47_09150 [Photobacterium indicum]|uniref:Uncharacterized protein n=1 Tax=Photobacterium indicum TaxID=81447 RepID=A0A2T3LBH2_9GAMM|nr:hypothetical protein C9J47_09150 [Photobacterium indicum]
MRIYALWLLFYVVLLQKVCVMYKRNLKHSRVNNLYKFVSAKMNRVFIAEGSPHIHSYEAQPVGFVYQCFNRDCPYKPDFNCVDSSNN